MASRGHCGRVCTSAEVRQGHGATVTREGPTQPCHTAAGLEVTRPPGDPLKAQERPRSTCSKSWELL